MEFNRQTTFDKVVAHLRTQKRRAYDPAKRSCRYLAPDGAKCAIGAFISVVNYDPTLEGAHASAPKVVAAAFPGQHLDLGDMDFVDSLQFMHDGNLTGPYDGNGNRQELPEAEFLETLELCANQFASDWGLTYTPPA